MANEAHKEPTMEEILASIRKIISDDAAAPASAPEPEPEIANDEEDDVSLEEVMFDEDIREEAAEADAAEEFEMESFEIEDFSAEEPPEAAPEPAQSFESLLSASRAAEAEPEPAPRPVPEPVAVAVAPAPAQPEPAPEPAPVEKPMSASPAYDNASLTDESTANAAAGALGKLISKMDLGADNTLEGLVRELLRPMIKEWLDANLATIVEQKVEAEVERISRMAR
jgi:cell pole-organizing protein PopZ